MTNQQNALVMSLCQDPLMRKYYRSYFFFLDAIQTGGPATSRQENNLPVPPARSAMANLYPRSQQPGHQTNPVVNVIIYLL